jgi:hypothetical protein
MAFAAKYVNGGVMDVWTVMTLISLSSLGREASHLAKEYWHGYLFAAINVFPYVSSVDVTM